MIKEYSLCRSSREPFLYELYRPTLNLTLLYGSQESVQPQRPRKELEFVTGPAMVSIPINDTCIGDPSFGLKSEFLDPLLYDCLSTTLSPDQCSSTAPSVYRRLLRICLTSTPPPLMRLLPSTCLFRPSDCPDCVMAVAAGV